MNTQTTTNAVAPEVMAALHGIVGQVRNGEHPSFKAYEEEAMECWAYYTNDETLLGSLHERYSRAGAELLNEMDALLAARPAKDELMTQLRMRLSAERLELSRLSAEKLVASNGAELATLDMQWDTHDWAFSLMARLLALLEN